MAALGHTYATSGRHDEAEKVLDEIKELSRHNFVSPYSLARVYAGLGRNEQALDWLKRHTAKKHGILVYLKVEPAFDGLRSEPRFNESSAVNEPRLTLQSYFGLRKGQNALMSNAPNKIIYSMVGVAKYYDKKPVFKDIYLSYFYGAKIGVIGLNGSGKSSLLRIIAGVDTEFAGETCVSQATQWGS